MVSEHRPLFCTHSHLNERVFVFINLKVFAQKLGAVQRETRSHQDQSELVQNARFRPKGHQHVRPYHIEKKRFWILRLENFERKKSRKHKYRGDLPANLADPGSRHAAGGTPGRPAHAGQASQRRRAQRWSRRFGGLPVRGTAPHCATPRSAGQLLASPTVNVYRVHTYLGSLPGQSRSEGFQHS
jgi:hypothetical protein